MVSIICRRKGKQDYYYMYHDSKKVREGRRRQYEEYLGKEIPDNIEERKQEFALRIERSQWSDTLSRIHDGFQNKIKSIPKSALEKSIKEFSVRFTYSTQRIEGSTLTLRDTMLLFEDDITPSNRPNADVKEAEAHVQVFLEAIKQHDRPSLRMVKEWHRALFRNT